MPGGVGMDDKVLEAAISHAGFGLCLLDSDSRVVQANPGWCAAVGLSKEQALGRNILDIFPEEAEGAESLKADLLAGKTVHVHRRRGKTEEQRWWDATISPVPSQDGIYFLVAIHEVSALVDEMEALSNQLSVTGAKVEELSREEERFRLLAENSQDIVFRFHFKPVPGFDY